jgi:hypothetical protein
MCGQRAVIWGSPPDQRMLRHTNPGVQNASPQLLHPLPHRTPFSEEALQGIRGAFPYAVIKVNDPNYLNIYRLEMHVGDRASFDASSIDRVSIDVGGASGVQIPYPSDFDWSFSFLIESGSFYASDDTDFFDLTAVHDVTGGTNCGPTYGIDAEGRIIPWLFINGTTHVNIWPTTQYGPVITQRVWHHLRTVCRFDTAANGGFCQTWYDGAQIFSWTGDGLGSSAGAPFWVNNSCYRGSNSPPCKGPFCCWFANVEFAVGSRPFASRTTSPLPCPPL